MTDQWTNIFTGVEDPDRIILLNLPDKKLFKVCQLDKYAEKLCNNGFWMRRFEQTFGATIGEGNKINYREEYKKYLKLSTNDMIKYAIQNKNNDLAVALINKHVIPVLQKQNDLDKRGFFLVKYFEMSVEYDNFPIFIVLYKIAEEFKIDIAYHMEDIMDRAATQGSYSIVKFIIETLKYDPTDKVFIMTAAARSNNLATIRFLHQHGYPLSQTIFEIALAKKNIDMIKYFIEEAAEKLHDVRLAVDALNGLVRLGTKMLTYIQTHGYDIVKNNPGILFYAIDTGKENVVKWLIDHGADVNIGGTLLKSLKRGNYKITKLLIDAGADPNNKEVILNLISNYYLYEPGDSPLKFLMENGLNLFETADIISKAVQDSYYRVSIGALKYLFTVVSELGTENQRQEFYNKILIEMIKEYSFDDLSKLLRDYDIKGTKELFSAAVKYGFESFANLLIKQGLKEFEPGIVAKVTIEPTCSVELLRNMFAAGAVLTDEDIKRLISSSLRYSDDFMDKLRFLSENGLKISTIPKLIEFLSQNYVMRDDDILFLYDNGVKEFMNPQIENRLQFLLKQRTKSTKSTPKSAGKGKEKESSKEVESSTELVRCAGKTQTGAQCKRKCPKDDEYCFAHK